MAIQFDDSTPEDYYLITDDTALSLADEDWCIGIWTRVDVSTGSNFQYLISTGNFGATNSFNFFLSDASQSIPDVWSFFMDDSAANSIRLDSASTPGADGKDRLIIVQRNTGTSLFEMFFCEFGQTATSQDTISDVGMGTSDGGAWNIGRRADGNTDRFYDSIAAEFFMGKFILTTDEITALGRGVPIWALGKTPTVYLPMAEAGHSQIDLFGTHDGAENGAPATAEHFKMRSRNPIRITVPGLVAAAGRIMSSLAGAGGLAYKGGIAGPGGGLAGS